MITTLIMTHLNCQYVDPFFGKSLDECAGEMLDSGHWYEPTGTRGCAHYITHPVYKALRSNPAHSR
jgi:hypothetical protein